MSDLPEQLYLKNKNSKIDKTLAGEMFAYSPIVTVIITVALFVLSQVGAVIIVSLLLAIVGQVSGRSLSYEEQSVWQQFVLTFAMEAIVVGGVWFALKTKQQTMQRIGLIRAKFIDVGYALAGFAVYFPLLIASNVLLRRIIPSINFDQKQELGFSQSAHGLPLFVIFISLVVLPPLAEEILFRGFLMGGLKTKLKPVVVALIVSVLFAMPHLLTGGAGTVLWPAAIDTFILSLVLVILRYKSGSLWPCIFLHMLKNGIAFAALFVFHV